MWHVKVNVNDRVPDQLSPRGRVEAIPLEDGPFLRVGARSRAR